MFAGGGQMWLAAGVLVVAYAAVISERINRAVAALLGACLMVCLGILTQAEAVGGIDFNTIGLLIGMMVIVSVVRRSGLFEFLAIWSAKRVAAHPAGIMLMLQVVTAVVSALLDNVTTVLLVVPVTLVICERLRVEPYPFLVSQIFAANIGGTATLVGDPPNILIGSMVGLSFNDFLTNLAPAVVLIQVIALAVFHMIWARALRASPEARAAVMAFRERDAIRDPRLLKQSLAVIGCVLVAFVAARKLGLEPATIALFGAAILMLLYCLGRPHEEQSKFVARSFEEAEWTTIFFFVGLFIMVRGVEVTGLLDLCADRVLGATGGNGAATALAILWGSAVFSALVDNIPFVATMVPLIKSMAPTLGGPEGLMPLWWALSLGACLGGNGTLVGASANLTVAGIANRAGVRFCFLTYAKVAFPLMLGTVALGHAYLVLRYL